MKITFFNQNPPNTTFAEGAFDQNIGKEVPLKNSAGEIIGKGKILEVNVLADGIEITYETDISLDIILNLEVEL